MSSVLPRLTRPTLTAVLALLAFTAAGCAAPDPSSVEGIVVQEGLDVDVEIVADAVPGPTQFVVVDGSLVVATINGAENDGDGRVIRIDLDSTIADEGSAGEPAGRTVLLDNLDKPTGLAIVDDELWVMERDRLTRSPLNVDNSSGAIAGAGAPTVVADDLPNNGRSEGTLTITPQNHVLFNTSGSKRGSDVVAGSGRLFLVDPADAPGNPVELASGFKNAYAHVYDESGRLWTTEVSDGRFDGEPAADELVPVADGVDHGWPFCVGDNRPVAEYGGNADRCAALPRSQAIFTPGATPTSVARSPFDPDHLVVALWLEGRVVSVDMAAEGPVEPVTLVSGLVGPQHLVSTDGQLWISEFGKDRILRLTERD